MNEAILNQVLLFSGYNVRAVIAICRLLKSLGKRAYVVANNQYDPIFKTDYAAWVCYTREYAALDMPCFQRIVKTIHQKTHYQEFVLMPSSEFLNRFALRHLEALKKLSIKVPLVNIELYKKLSDKSEFRDFCMQNGISVPKAVNCTHFSLPFVAKQKHLERGGQKQAKPYLILDKGSLQNFTLSENKEDYYFEDFLTGESVYLLMYLGEKTSIIYSQQNLIQQAAGGSIIAAKTSRFHFTSEAKKMIYALECCHFHGLIMVEFRIERNQAYMIEANPRFWGPLQFCVDNCPQLLIQFLLDCEIIDNDSSVIQTQYKDYYFWFGGCLKDIHVRKQVFIHESNEPVALLSKLDIWLANDIFLREDTIELFQLELTEAIFT